MSPPARRRAYRAASSKPPWPSIAAQVLNAGDAGTRPSRTSRCQTAQASTKAGDAAGEHGQADRLGQLDLRHALGIGADDVPFQRPPLPEAGVDRRQRHLDQSRRHRPVGHQRRQRPAIGAGRVVAWKVGAPGVAGEGEGRHRPREAGEPDRRLDLRLGASGGAEFGDMMGGDRLVGRDQDAQPDEFLAPLVEMARRQGERGIGCVVGLEQRRIGHRQEAVMRQQEAALGAHRGQPGGGRRGLVAGGGFGRIGHDSASFRSVPLADRCAAGA